MSQFQTVFNLRKKKFLKNNKFIVKSFFDISLKKKID
jgi:hypothetical protein